MVQERRILVNQEKLVNSDKDPDFQSETRPNERKDFQMGIVWKRASFDSAIEKRLGLVFVWVIKKKET